MSAPSLRDELAALLGPAFLAETGSTWLYDKGQFVADAVLGSEALQSIRAAFVRILEPPHGPNYSVIERRLVQPEEIVRRQIEWLGLSPSVVAWVMQEDAT